MGWEIAPFQPRHPRVEKAGAIMASEAGIEAQFIPSAPIIWAWDIPPFQPPVAPAVGLRWTGALLIGHHGIDAPFVNVPPPIVLPPPAGGGKRKKTAKQLEQERKTAALVEKAKLALSPGDVARAKIAEKLRGAIPAAPTKEAAKVVAFPKTKKPILGPINITPEELLVLFNALQNLDDDDDED